MSKTLTAIATLIGTVIGAGILGMPFVIAKSGFFLGLINMLIIAGIITITHLYLGEIGLRTKTNHQLTGYASLYLGKKGKLLMFLAFAFGIYSALIAYLIGEAESLSFLFFNTSSFAIYFGIAFWLVLSALTYFGLNALQKGEKLGVAAILILIVLIVAFFWNKININNLTYNNLQNFFVPFGVILFAFLGFAAIPEVERILEKEKQNTKKTILISNLLVLIVYIIFTLVVLGSQGSSTPELATLALGKIFVILGMFTMGTSYLALSIALINTFRFDYKVKKTTAWLCTISLPLIIYLILIFFNRVSFIKLLGIGGVISGGLMGILILAMIKKAKLSGKRSPEYSIPYSKFLAGVIILILVIGTILEMFNAF